MLFFPITCDSDFRDVFYQAAVSSLGGWHLAHAVEEVSESALLPLIVAACCWTFRDALLNAVPPRRASRNRAATTCGVSVGIIANAHWWPVLSIGSQQGPSDFYNFNSMGCFWESPGVSDASKG